VGHIQEIAPRVHGRVVEPSTRRVRGQIDVADELETHLDLPMMSIGIYGRLVLATRVRQ
jgi:hypothetical protein